MNHRTIHLTVVASNSVTLIWRRARSVSQLELHRLTDALFNDFVNNDSMAWAGRLSANKVDSA